MLRLTRKLSSPSESQASLTLPLEKRSRSRQRVTLDDGREAGLFLQRGSVLRDGDQIAGDGGLVVTIRAAAEPVSQVPCSDPLLLARACYHLGNRHVALQIGKDWLRYSHDHVLDEMLRGMGLNPQHETAPFDPEPGAYGEHGQTAGHGHEH